VYPNLVRQHAVDEEEEVEHGIHEHLEGHEAVERNRQLDAGCGDIENVRRLVQQQQWQAPGRGT
jgi:hypothetical protein